MTARQFWAHSPGNNEPTPGQHAGWQPLAEHLEAVADLSAQLAALARPADTTFIENARLAGLLHDFGKYSDAFQRRITAGGRKCQHAIHGAIVAAGELHAPFRPLPALAIAGHHAGIPDLQGGSTTLWQKLQKDELRAEAAQLVSRAAGDSELVKAALAQAATGSVSHRMENSEKDLYTRMLFSCLVDADRLNTAGHKPVQASLRAVDLLGALLAHLDGLSRAGSENPINAFRRQVLLDCLDAASRPESLFSLSVPTGGGKTLAAMAFALRRAALAPENFRRIVVVIPYLSIIEQNARVYAEVFGPDAVLEHHSGSTMPLQPRRSESEESWYTPASDEDDEQEQALGQRAETENWDAPIVVTTSTRFFESLFSNRPKDLRRAHNIARSIVILDEVQTVPRRLLAPLLRMQKELADRWGVNFVFSTATQPAFEDPPGRESRLLWRRGTVMEIVREPEPLRKALARAHIEWRLDETMSWEQVTARMIERPQCLAIVNLRDHASELYCLLKEKMPPGACFHLSTRMCAAHRLRTIDEIRARLKAGLECRVVSTQLIEAGVDLDFSLVLRALAPLDSIVQAAGRADREGRLTAKFGRPGGEVVVFRPEDDRMPPHEYKEAACVTEAIAKQAIEDGASVQVDDAEAMREFYERYYDTGDPEALGSKLNAMRDRLKFATLADEFEYINSRTQDVFVPDDEDARAAIDELNQVGQLTFDLRRRLQRHSVGLNPTEFEMAKSSGAVRSIRPGSEFWVAAPQAYSAELGLLKDIPAASFVL